MSAYAEWNQRQDRIVIPFNTRVNLDELFGNVHSNVICERITPCKLAIYVLIQSLDELHQDVQPFTSSEHCALLSAIYGMIEHGDMSYLEVRRVVRWMDRTVRAGIYKDFVEFMKSYVNGDDIMVQIDVILQTRPGVVNFVCGKSYLGIWLKKLFSEWSQMSTQHIFDFNTKFVEWIQAADSHMDDSQRMDETNPILVSWFKTWSSDVFVDHYVWSLKITRSSADSGIPITQPAVVPFEVESSGRARKWISNQMHLLQVCPSAALPDNEIVDWCQLIRKNHVDIVEVHLLEMLCHIRTMNLGGAAESLRLYFDYSMFRIDGEDHRDPAINSVESEQLFDQMNALVHLMAAITAARRCKPPTIVEDGLERAMRCSSGSDDGGRARLIKDAAIATTSSVRLRHGLAKTAQSLATSLVETNYADGSAPKHETEAHVIAGVNMVYACAMNGEWDRSSHILQRLKTVFTPELNWQTAQYVHLCDSIITFDIAILRGEWEKCTPLLEDIEVLDEAEAALRRCFLMAVRGEISSGRNLLETLYAKYETPATIFTHLRLRLQLAMMLSAECRWSAATEMLQGVREEAISIEQRNIAAMALRRIGVVQLMSGDQISALKSFTECHEPISRCCSILEKALLSIGLAQAHMIEDNKKESSKMLNKARVQCRQAGAVLVEKYVLQELAVCYNEEGKIDERDDCAAEFAAIDERYSGYFDWKLI
ncbi:hypothetical protein NECAME_15615 [Necator americanus]|uniref:Anaphase-promoting complex subunit 5 n=1 Tax=Necator americanus TaxID=51031 RepID=W2SGQ5_NECAM|nr:hypothetical protein NECAME_15615 [Necator americanus]ETN68804.1 hypothetical protein NECAME_15615 [Necator americanus]